MHRSAALLAILALTLTVSTTPASADPPEPQVPMGSEPQVERPPNVGGRIDRSRRPPRDITIETHDQFKVDAATSGAVRKSIEHGDWLSLDYAASTGADTLYWSNNKALTGTAAQLAGPLPLYTVTDAGCPERSTNFAQFSHNEYAVRITVTHTDGVGNVWTFTNDYWHMGTISTGTKVNGASFGTQATHPISGCKYYYLPGTADHGKLASTAPHIHHTAWQATTYQEPPLRFVWTMLSH